MDDGDAEVDGLTFDTEAEPDEDLDGEDTEFDGELTLESGEGMSAILGWDWEDWNE